MFDFCPRGYAIQARCFYFCKMSCPRIWIIKKTIPEAKSSRGHSSLVDHIFPDGREFKIGFMFGHFFRNKK